jgi:membrane protease YdiL (CAAX protease family)
LRNAGPAALPNRYRIRHEGREAVLTCVEAPTVKVRIRRGVTVTAAAARGYPAGSIFLDGAAQGEPFLDPERAVYNLDHHEGCIRAFTLATCEQAMVLLRKRVDLRKRDWTLYANDADLDTVLAIWVLVNHLRLSGEESKTRAAIMPLLRLEGCIDALGLELQDLCALPPAAMDLARQQMNSLLERERKAKADGSWERGDLAAFVASQLRAIDRMVYPAAELENVAEVEELARTEIAAGSVAVVCKAKLGIYELERQLRRVHGDRLGMIVLQKDAKTYTLRQVDPTLPGSLDRVYARLNLLDSGSDGSLGSNRWGGSEEIGGSPRTRGTKLSPAAIAAACRDAHQRPSLLAGLRLVGRAGLVSALVVTGLLPASLQALQRLWPGLPDLALDPALTFAGLLTLLAGGLLLGYGRRAPGVYGLRPPAGLDWWALLPLAGLGALAGGVWIPGGPPLLGVAGLEPARLAALVCVPVASELLFRGLVHGNLASHFPIQLAGGPWRISGPTAVSSILYAVWTSLPLLGSLALVHDRLGAGAPGVSLIGALAFGLAAGMARERSESLLTPILFHWICVGGVWLTAVYGKSLGL